MLGFWTSRALTFFLFISGAHLIRTWDSRHFAQKRFFISSETGFGATADNRIFRHWLCFVIYFFHWF